MDTRIESAILDTLSLWKFSELRQNQLSVINSFCAGNDVFVALPTGSGKSVCYWILPSIFKTLRTIKIGPHLLLLVPYKR